MQIIETIEEMRRNVADARRRGLGVSLVPTMGAFHEGHLQLMRYAVAQGGYSVASLFVNPLQFAPGEDLDRYPKNWGQDAEQAEAIALSALFVPSVVTMYPDGPPLTRITVEPLSRVLCGVQRPTHFSGVATVVAKLLAVVEPDVAIFGQKDAQQVAIIRRMVQDLNIPTRIVAHPTVRETDGLAMSSRNRYLDASARTRAAHLYASLQTAEAAYTRGIRDPRELIAMTTRYLTARGIAPEYVAIVDPVTLEPVASPMGSAPALMALAARIGTTRLIDNVLLGGEASDSGTGI